MGVIWPDIFCFGTHLNISLPNSFFHPASTGLGERRFFEALKPTDRLCDFVTDGQELTALVVASLAGEFFCQVGGGSGGWHGFGDGERIFQCVKGLGIWDDILHLKIKRNPNSSRIWMDTSISCPSH